MIWLGFALVALVVLLLMATVRAPKVKPTDALAHFRAQLNELEEDEARGVIGADEAKAARLEIERRILKAADNKAEAAPEDTAGKTPLPLLLAIAAIAGAVALYMFLGRPDLPSAPAAVIVAREAPVKPGGPTYDAAIKAVEAHLKKDPTDKKGWLVLAKAARSVQEFHVSADAYGKLVELDPDNIRWRIERFEAFLALANGQVTPASRMLLADIIQREPNHPAGQYYLGLAYLQAGKTDEARKVWTALANRSAPDAPWMPGLKAQIAKLGGEGAPPALSKGQMAAVAGMNEKDRKAFIHSMMDRLSAKLEANPDDADGWMMLARSHLTMGDKDAAVAALKRGLASVTDADKKAEMQAFLDKIATKSDP